MPLTNSEKEEMIAQAMETPEGKMKLAQIVGGVISDALEIFGVTEEYLMAHEDTRETALRCLARYESNIAKGKIFHEDIIRGVNAIYDKWEIKRGTALGELNPKIKKEIELEDPIESRFDILDL